MALGLSVAMPSLPQKSKVKLLKDQHYVLRRRSKLLCVYSKRVVMSFKNFSMGGGSNGANDVKMKLEIAREKIWQSLPEPVKDFPWKKAEKTFLEQITFIGKKALKWSMLVLFILSFSSDCVYSISRNRELSIPLGLFVGVLVTNFLKEMAMEVFRPLEENSRKEHLSGIGCLFVLVKCISLSSRVPARLFLSHMANGGLMQAIWLWRILLIEKDKENEEGSSVLAKQGAS